jgi:simple sugar transport system ATP-binding protein
MDEIVLKVENLSKVFPKVVANKDIGFALHKGEILAVLGENGAGKSTLMNCICGLYKPTIGDIYIKGEKVEFESSEDSEKKGIGMVHQHFMLINTLTVAENVFLGLSQGVTPFINIKKVEREVKALSDQYGFGINPKDKVGGLSVGVQQKVEILKILYRKADIIILDEATAVLTPQESKDLFEIVNKLVQEGKSVLMITHKMDEVMDYADRVLVLRDGEMAGLVTRRETLPDGEKIVRNITPKELANMMVGREVILKFDRKPSVREETLLQVQDLEVFDDKKIRRVKDISFSLHAGEILGIAGVDGNGQIELAEAVTGLRRFSKGSVTFGGDEQKNVRIRDAYAKGLSYIPQDRQQTGLILNLSVDSNLLLQGIGQPPYSKHGIIQHAQVKRHGEEMIAGYNVKAPSGAVPVKELSGGNQQKVILARELDRAPKVLVAVQPTRGLDIGATEFVREKLLAEKEKGMGILLVSTELEEILAISDRIAVIHEGRFMGILPNNGSTSIEEIGLMMAGMSVKVGA